MKAIGTWKVESTLANVYQSPLHFASASKGFEENPWRWEFEGAFTRLTVWFKCETEWKLLCMRGVFSGS